MKCVVCKHGQTQPGHTTVILERDGGALVIRKVPAEVCENCGEAYVSAEVTRNLLESGRVAWTRLDRKVFGCPRFGL